MHSLPARSLDNPILIVFSPNIRKAGQFRESAVSGLRYRGFRSSALAFFDRWFRIVYADRNQLNEMTDSKYNADDQRMIRLQEGDQHAFDEIVAEWQSPLYGFFFRNTRDAQRSEDLVQETMLRLFRKAWDYIPTGRFRGWLFRVARNLLIDNVRRQNTDALVRRVTAAISPDGELTDLLSLLPGDTKSAELRVAEDELADTVREMLVELPEEQRQTFIMHPHHSLTLSEVADAMNTSLPTAKSRLRLAKEKLRYQLSCRGFGDESVSQNT